MNTSNFDKVGSYLKTKLWVKLAEIVFLFAAATLSIYFLEPLMGDHPVLRQGAVWIANLIMLLIIWMGLKLRGESWSDVGLTFHPINLKNSFRLFYQSLMVFIFAMIGFFLGSMIMANITGIPEGADLSGYEYLKDNITMLFLSLLGVYIVSSFSEEVIYRAFLINRITELGFGDKTGKVLAILFSSIIFGLVHYKWGAFGVVQTGFMGLALALSYIKLKKRLWVLIIAHAYMDTVLLVQMYLASS